MIGPHQQTAGIADLARPRPIADEILELAPRPDDMSDDIEAEFAAELLRRLDPGFAADAGQHGELAAAGEIERRMLAAVAVEHEDMRQPGAGPGGRRVVQFRVLRERRL